MNKKTLSLIPVGIVLVGVLGYLLYGRVTQPLKARTETARLICETSILSTLKEASEVISAARSQTTRRSLAELVDDSRRLKMRLGEITHLVQERAGGDSAPARALREVASLDSKEHDAFAASSADLAMRRCPDRANDRALVLKAVEAITAVIKSMPR